MRSNAFPWSLEQFSKNVFCCLKGIVIPLFMFFKLALQQSTPMTNMRAYVSPSFLARGCVFCVCVCLRVCVCVCVCVWVHWCTVTKTFIRNALLKIEVCLIYRYIREFNFQFAFVLISLYWNRIAVYIISSNKRSGAYLKFFCILLLFFEKVRLFGEV